MSNYFVGIVFAGLAVLGAASSGHSLWGASVSSRAEKASSLVWIESPRSSDGKLAVFTPEVESALQASLRAASQSATPKDTLRAVEWLGEKARLAEGRSEQIPYLCQSLHLYGAALQKNPLSIPLLLGAANQRQLLGGHRCVELYTSVDVSDLVARAHYWSPYQHSVLFGGGLLRLWSGDKEGALKLFGELLKYYPDISAGEKSTILDEIKSPGGFKVVVPARIPQIFEWSRLLKEQRPADFNKWQQILSEMQLAAIAESQSRVASGALPVEAFERGVLKLSEVPASDEVRRKLDLELAKRLTQRGDFEAARFFQGRSELQELAIVRAQIAGDTRPIKSPLVRWEESASVFLDDFHQSVGFFLPPQQGVSMIVLKSPQSKQKFERSGLRIFGSDDNESWIEIAPQRAEVLTTSGQETVAISLQLEGHRYWKINNSSGQRTRVFGGEISDFISVYGRSSRKGGGQ